MLRFLAVLRRSMLIGVVTLIVSFFVIKLDYMELVEKAWPLSGFPMTVRKAISLSFTLPRKQKDSRPLPDMPALPCMCADT